MGTGDKMLRGNLRWTSIPSRGSINTPSRLHATEIEISSGSVDQFGPSSAFTQTLKGFSLNKPNVSNSINLNGRFASRTRMLEVSFVYNRNYCRNMTVFTSSHSDPFYFIFDLYLQNQT